MFLCNNCVNCNKYHFISYGICESCNYTGPCNDCPPFHIEKKEEKMERVKIEIPLACGCSITERLDPLNSSELLRPIYSKHVLQNDAVKNTQYITFKRSPHCTEHNNRVSKVKKNYSLEKVKEIIRINFPNQISSEDATDLYRFIDAFIDARVR